MRIGRLLGISMLSVTALTVVLAIQILIPQTRTFAGKTEAIKSVEVFGRMLIVGQQLAALRAPYNLVLLQPGAATPDQLEAIAKSTRSIDVAFANARTVSDDLDYSATILGGLERAATRLGEVRTIADRAAIVPMQARDPGASKVFVEGIVDVSAVIAPILNRLENNVAAVEEQGAATEEISRNVQRAAQGTQQVSTSIFDVQSGAGAIGASAAQVSAAAESLSSESGRLKFAVERFLKAVRGA